MKKHFPIDNPGPTKLYLVIAETIKKFYPIGISSLESAYNEHLGIKLISDILVKEIVDNKNYRRKWGAFLNNIRKESNKEVDSTTYGVGPGYSGDLILETYQDAALIRIKRLAFAVSLLGPFYSICGIDETFIKDDDVKKYHAINVVTVSPYKEFEADFNGLKLLIEKQFKDYLFVPFEVCMKEIKDLEMRYAPGSDAKVYDALFNHLFNYYTHHFSRGERWYGMERNPNVRVTLTAPRRQDDSVSDKPDN